MALFAHGLIRGFMPAAIIAQILIFRKRLSRNMGGDAREDYDLLTPMAPPRALSK
jgi:hypothetical protein